MIRIPLQRWWPSIAAFGVLALAAIGSRSRAGDPAGATVDATIAGACQLLVEQSPSGTPYMLLPLEGVAQPFAGEQNFAACSLRVQYAYSSVTATLYEWDPMLLAPNPTTISLRTRGFGPSEFLYQALRMDFDPPVVTKSVPGLAEPPFATTALELRALQYSQPAPMYLDAAAPNAQPTALRVLSNGARVPESGAHPVLTHALCGGNATLQSLRLAQSVTSTNVALPLTTFEIAQRFRVPATVDAHWIELALASTEYAYPFVPGTVAIYDASGQASPPLTLANPLVSVMVDGRYFLAPVWMTTYDAFGQPVRLEAGHDYWLCVRTENRHRFYAKNVTGGEDAAFAANIGPLFTRAAGGALWSQSAAQALCFKLVGLPIGSLDAPVAAARRTLDLGVAPNPSRGASLVTWAGADGATRLEVLDARGRRVATGDGAAGSGRWSFAFRDGSGRPLPSGTYFVRATDAAGKVAAARVVLLR